MAGESKQIYQLTSRTFNGSSLVPFEVPNTDPSTSAENPYVTGKTTGNEVSEFVAIKQEYETDLETDSKTIIGAINELKEGGGGNADKVELTQAEYDELSEEEKHNGKLYFITDGQAGGGGSVDFVEESIPDIPERELPYYPSGEYSTLNTNDKHIVGAINELKIQSKSVSGTTSASGAIGLGLPSGAKVLNVVVTSATNQFAFFRHDGYAHIYQMSEASSTLGNLVRMANISVTVEVYYFV